MSPTWADLAACEWPGLTGEHCDRKATEGVLRQVFCQQHAAELREANTWPEEDRRYAECQERDRYGAPCGRRCDGATYCRDHTPQAWAAAAMAGRPTREAIRAQEPPW